MLRRLWGVGMRRGLLGGSRPWTALFVAATVLRLVRRAGAGKEIVYKGKLDPGTSLLITSNPSATAALDEISARLEA